MGTDGGWSWADADVEVMSSAIAENCGCPGWARRPEEYAMQSLIAVRGLGRGTSGFAALPVLLSQE